MHELARCKIDSISLEDPVATSSLLNFHQVLEAKCERKGMLISDVFSSVSGVLKDVSISPSSVPPDQLRPSDHSPAVEEIHRADLLGKFSWPARKPFAPPSPPTQLAR